MITVLAPSVILLKRNDYIYVKFKILASINMIYQLNPFLNRKT